jgi:glycosyltransferase involved in cell wall biosynthesis
MPLIVDYTHVGRKVTGIERIAIELFSPRALKGLPAVHVTSKIGAARLMASQWLKLPLRAATDRQSIVLCPGFPPSIPLTLLCRHRVVAYIHDLFLLTRSCDLNHRARLYLRPSFRAAVRHLRHFLVNSLYTKLELEKFCRTDAQVRLLRPHVRNVFELSPDRRSATTRSTDPLRLVSIGTIEPRKNYPAALRIRAALERRRNAPVELHIIGRRGWGQQDPELSSNTRVFVYGYQSTQDTKAILEAADLFLSTSLGEGLGLPLLEVQHGGMPVVASRIPAFQEVLGTSGTLVDSESPEAAAASIDALVSRPHWRAEEANAALANVTRWNALAAVDRQQFLAWAQAALAR